MRYESNGILIQCSEVGLANKGVEQALSVSIKCTSKGDGAAG